MASNSDAKRSSFMSMGEVSFDESDSASNLETHNSYGVPSCECRRKSKAVVYTSKTSKNPYRTFYGCRYYKEGKTHCKYFKWVDEHIDERLAELEEGKQNLEMDTKVIEVMMKDMQEKMKEIMGWKKKMKVMIGFMIVIVIIAMVSRQ
ncbi:hypothetical protein RIF29_17159 [Crotalaria pallida]|uniref:GRF-type domain-containing protein n=1 Tax=Crotalaria pallida TaxID=3830 RepID=A0AAN9FNL2_CROPI